MPDSPFIYGSTVSQQSFTDREDDSKKLFQNLTQGINTTIISPRRWGKSSLVEKVILDIQSKKKTHKTVLIDLFTVSTEEEFLESFAREVIKASSTKWQEWVSAGKLFFKRLIPKISVGSDPTMDFNVSFDWNDLERHKDEILNLPETIAQQKKINLIVCLDEFQNLATFKSYNHLEKQMRANWQRHKKVTYCLYGSKRHMMSEIFNNPSKPFYRFGDIMLLQKISSEDWEKFLIQSFSSTGKSIAPECASKIPLLMKNHSWYVQQLAHYTWLKTTKKADQTQISSALNELIRANTPFYQKEVESISTTQLNLLKAVVKGETQFTSTKVMNTYRLGTPRNVSKNKTILVNSDVIHQVNGHYEFLDPAFELWFRKQYFNEAYD